MELSVRMVARAVCEVACYLDREGARSVLRSVCRRGYVRWYGCRVVGSGGSAGLARGRRAHVCGGLDV
jgi:hypothetical protein